MKKSDWIFLAVLILLIAGFVWFVSSMARAGAEEQRKRYSECKERTQDIEWCFKRFQPNLD